MMGVPRRGFPGDISHKPLRTRRKGVNAIQCVQECIHISQPTMS